MAAALVRALLEWWMFARAFWKTVIASVLLLVSMVLLLLYVSMLCAGLFHLSMPVVWSRSFGVSCFISKADDAGLFMYELD